MSDRSDTDQRVLQPPAWRRPRGYANGIVAGGETIFLAGQIGWDAQGHFAEGLANQVGQALANIVTLLAEAGAEPRHLVRLTWFVTDLRAYREQPDDHRSGLSSRHRQALSHHVGDRRVATGGAGGTGGNRGDRRSAAQARARSLTPKLSSPEIIPPACAMHLGPIRQQGVSNESASVRGRHGHRDFLAYRQRRRRRSRSAPSCRSAAPARRWASATRARSTSSPARSPDRRWNTSSATMRRTPTPRSPSRRR